MFLQQLCRLYLALDGQFATGGKFQMRSMETYMNKYRPTMKYKLYAINYWEFTSSFCPTSSISIPILFDHVCQLFANHKTGCIRVSCDRLW